MLSILLPCTCILISCVFVLKLLIYILKKRQSLRGRTVGFFHPYCNAGGGGERVLWCAIRAIQETYPDINCIVYTGDTDVQDDSEFIQRAKDRFNVEVKNPVMFVRLSSRFLVEAERYPHFTLLGQSFGGLLLGCEALMKFVPDVFIDSMGYALTLPLFRFVGGCAVGCYVHYPTISTDMLEMVATQKASYNNQDIVARNYLLSRLKLLYYLMFAALYGTVGRCAHVILCNSTWTKNQILALWRRPDRTFLVYPPCDVASFRLIEQQGSEELYRSERRVRLLSIGQFRPEKNHKLQLEVLKLAIDRLKHLNINLRLVFVGGCRHEADRQRVTDLQAEAAKLKISEFVDWKLNVSFDELKSELSKAMLGIHTMVNEHFGIGIVESMAAGSIMMAHDSAGPKSDIVVPSSGDDSVGYLCTEASDYVEAIEAVLSLSAEQRSALRKRASLAIGRFTDAEFAKNVLHGLEAILK